MSTRNTCPVIATMRHFGMRITRRVYVQMAFECQPEELDGELRAEADAAFREIAAEQRADNLRLRALGVSTRRRK